MVEMIIGSQKDGKYGMKKKICLICMIICMFGILGACGSTSENKAIVISEETTLAAPEGTTDAASEGTTISAPDETAAPVAEETVITLVWDSNQIDVGISEWNRHSVLISTEDPGLGNGKIYDFAGVKLFDLMELAGVHECAKALVKSTDGMIGEVSAEDFRNYDIALVNGYSDGKPLAADVGGPVKIVFPISEHPELNDTYTLRSWQWYVCEVEFASQTADEKHEAAGTFAEPENSGTKEASGINAESENSGIREPAGTALVNQDGKAEIPTGASAVEFGNADKCIIIVLDAFSSNYLTRLGSESGIARMTEEGASCLTARSTYPTHTCTNHTTIMTGVGAAKHGIVGNNRLGEDGVTTVKNIQPEMIQVSTLFQTASAAGKKTAFVSGKDNLVTLLSEGLDVGVSNKHPAEYLPDAPELTDSSNNDEYYQYNLDLADWVFESLFTVLEKEKPDLTLVNIQATDYIAHRFGPESKEMDACLLAVDKKLDKLLQKMEKAGMLEDTSVIVTADHGMTASDKAIPLIALSFMNFSEAGATIDGRNGYVWYGKEDREAVVQFFENVEGIRNVFERDSDEARSLNTDFPGGPDLFLESEPGYVFLSEPMIDLYHGQHGSRDDSDTIIPLILFGAGIPSHAEIAQSDLRCIAPLVCQLLRLEPGEFEGDVPLAYRTQK